jgi:hypothetical protein
VPVVTSLSTVALYLAYVIPVALALRARPAWPRLARWTLGRYGTAVNVISVVYTVAICIVLVMPPNALAGKTLAGVVAALFLVYWIEVRKKFRGPEWARGGALVQAGDRQR